MPGFSTHHQVSEAILKRRTELAADLVDREYARQSELEQCPGRIDREMSLQDAGSHLSYLAQAVALNNQALFIDYIAWARVVLVHRHVIGTELATKLECLAEVLRARLPVEDGTLAAGFVTAALLALPEMPNDMPTFLHEGEPLSPLAHQYLESLRRGERHLASRLILAAVAAGTSVKEIYLHVFQPAQYEIGRLWQLNQISVAQEHYCSAATQLIMSQLYPHIFASAKNGRTLVATCVSGDLHEIGVRMVADFFEMDGWSTFYLGANTPHAGVVASVIEQRADVLAVSATISYHVEAVQELIQSVREHQTARRVKILVGGYPFVKNRELWREIGADGSAPDAEQAIALANRLVDGGGE
ncbi:MAG: cobalamin-dependent protein [Verrucomicrobia bacterium]|nr:cobalamin-dependent protein [Verrucomicrobiota bacterium]